MNTDPKPNDSPVMYSAVGRLQGYYSPSKEIRSGTFTTADGSILPAILGNRAIKQAFDEDCKNWQECRKVLSEERNRVWTIYPRTTDQGSVVAMLIRYKEIQQTEQHGWSARKAQREGFYITGQICKIKADHVVVAVYYNNPSRQPQLTIHSQDTLPTPDFSLPPEKGFILKVWGTGIPPSAISQIWNIEAGCQSSRLVMLTAESYQDSQSKKAAKQRDPTLSDRTEQTKVSSTNLTQTPTQEQPIPPQKRPNPSKQKNRDASTSQKSGDQPAASALPQPQPNPKKAANNLKQEAKPTFKVIVNGHTYTGISSVALKSGMLLIDGKPIELTRIAVVIGNPQSVESDGKVDRSKEGQYILTGR